MGTWRFRLIRDDHASSFIRRPDSAGPFVGEVDEAIRFANRVQEYFSHEAKRVEAWSIGPVEEPEPGDRERFLIERHENGRDWRLLESRLTHPAWYLTLAHAIDYAAFRGRGHRLQISVCSGAVVETVIVSGRAEPTPAISPPTTVAFSGSAVSVA
jgi:hypothetical protein